MERELARWTYGRMLFGKPKALRRSLRVRMQLAMARAIKIRMRIAITAPPVAIPATTVLFPGLVKEMDAPFTSLTSWASKGPFPLSLDREILSWSPPTKSAPFTVVIISPRVTSVSSEKMGRMVEEEEDSINAGSELLTPGIPLPLNAGKGVGGVDGEGEEAGGKGLTSGVFEGV